jgi:Tol biopolymer transport system component
LTTKIVELYPYDVNIQRKSKGVREEKKMNKRIFSRVKRLAARIMLLAASVTLAVLFASCAAQRAGKGPTTRPASHTHNGKIAFSRLDNRDGQSDIFVMKADGTGVKRLATKPAGDTSPAFSPNGKRLAFEAESRSDNTPFDIDIYVMNVDGSGLKHITQEPTLDIMPTWSPDGTRIASSMVNAYSLPLRRASRTPRTRTVYTR